MKIYFISILVCMLASCIKVYDPDIETTDEEKYVIIGQITDDGGLQTINISRTSPIEDPEYVPVQHCHVTIRDDRGHQFFMNDMGDGNYTTLIDSTLVLPGVAFQLEVTTQAGDIFHSDFDTLATCPLVDSVYYSKEDLVGVVPNQPLLVTHGIQFYINLNGEKSNSRFYRWETFETWEYHADYPLIWYFDGQFHQVIPTDYSKKICWDTRKLPNIFTLTTGNLAENHYEMFPLHYVTNLTSRLVYGYSLLIKQYALSEAAYVYWDQLRTNSDHQGGLYEKQPLAIKGNMHNLTHPEQEVLGFFSAASVKSKRIFVKDVPDFPFDYSTGCYPFILEVRLDPADYPVYFLGDENALTDTMKTILNPECVNCTLLGGTNIKPDFWP